MPNALRFEVQAVCPTTGARAGLLHTPHGTIETPVFMPVGTQASVKALTQRHLKEDLNARIILGNTYHLYLRPGHELIDGFGGLHGFMNWDRAILTDSGGFQAFSLSELTKVHEDGVVFRSHLNGDEHKFTPASTVEVQMALGSDIMMVLDECLPYPSSHGAAEVSMRRTVRWAAESLAHHGSRAEQHFETRGRRQAVFPIVQGSMYADLRRDCARALVDLDAEGYAIGGLSVGEPRALSMAMTEASIPELPKDRPRYVMGVGKPEELPEYVARGVDMMDCVMPTRNARNGTLFTSNGKLLIKNKQYRDDGRPADEGCNCYTCKNHTRAYLRHLYQAGEIQYFTLATLHNLARYLDIMREIRQAILLGVFPQYLDRVRTLVGEIPSPQQ